MHTTCSKLQKLNAGFDRYENNYFIYSHFDFVYHFNITWYEFSQNPNDFETT